MADYTIDVKAKLDIKDLQTQSDKENIAINVSATKSSIKTLSNEIRDYFINSPVKTSLTVNKNQIRTFRTDINNYFSQNAILVGLDANYKSLNELAKRIEGYFVENPIKLTLSKETSGLDLQGFTEAINKLYQDQQNAFSQLTKQQIEDNKNSLQQQAIDVLSHYDEIKIQRQNDILNAQEYYEKLKEFAEDENNTKILLETKHASDLRKIRQDLTQAKIDLDNQEKKEEEIIIDERNQKARESAENYANWWQNKLNDVVEEFKIADKTIEELEQDIGNLESLGTSDYEDIQENYNKAIQSAKEYIEYRKQISSDSITIAQQEAEEETEILQEKIYRASETTNSIYDDYKNTISEQNSYIESLEEEHNQKISHQRQEAIQEAIQDNKNELEQKRKDKEEYAKASEEIDKQLVERSKEIFKEESKAMSELYSEDAMNKSLEAIDLANLYKEVMLEQINGWKNLEEEQNKSIESYIGNMVDLGNQLAEGSIEFEDFYNNIANGALKLHNLGLIDDETLNAFKSSLDTIEEAWNKSLEERKKDAEQSFKEEAELLILAYKNTEKDFNEFSKKLQEIIEEAQKDGLVSEKIIQEIKLKLKQIEDAYEKSNQKTIKDREKQNQDAIKQELSDTQDLYSKKLISAEEYVNRMSSILPRAFEAGVDGAQKFQNSVDKVSKELQEANNKTLSFSESLNRFGNSSDRIFNSLMRYFGVTQVISAVTNSFSKMVTEVRNLDVELTEFKKVSDLTDEGLQKFINDSYELGSTVAKTGTEVVTATTLFKKMGYTVDESMQFAKDALMWTNVADGMVSVEEASTMLISTMKAFGEESISTTHIIDALNEVSNNYSVSSSDLSNNLSTVAATLAASGVEFEEMIGLMTAGIEIMPDKASKVANGLKTISQRIRQIEGDTADKLDEFLGARGIERFDKTTNQLKSTYDILSEISKLWPKLTTNERQYLGEVMAGKNQITVLNAIMTNFKTSLDATTTAYASLGSAEKENARVMDSIEGHIKSFKSAFSELSKDIISSDTIKDVVDFGTRVLEWLDDIVKNRGPLIIKTITAIGVALASLRITQFAKTIPDIITSLGTLNPVLLAITASIGAISFVLAEASQEAKEAEKTSERLREAAYRDQKEKQELTEESIKQTISEYEKLRKKYEELDEGEDKDKIREQLLNIEKEIGSQGYEVDLLNGKYDEQLTKLKEIYAQEKLITLEKHKREFEEKQENFNPVQDVAKENFGNVDYTLDGQGASISLFVSDAKKIEDTYENINNIIVQETLRVTDALANGEQLITQQQGRTVKDILEDMTLSAEEKATIFRNMASEYAQLATQSGEDAEKAGKAVTDALQSGNNIVANQNLENKVLLEEQQDVLTNWAGSLNLLADSLEESGSEVETILQETRETVKAQLDAIGIDLNKLSSEDLTGLIDVIDKVDTGKLDPNDLPEKYQKFSDIIGNDQFRNSLRDIADESRTIVLNREAQAMEDEAGSVEVMGLSLSEAMATMDNYINSVKILNQAHMEFEETGQISADTLKAIANAGLETYLITDELTGSLDVDTQAFLDNNKSVEDNAVALYIAGQRQSLLNSLKNEGVTATNNATSKLSEEKKAVENYTKELQNETLQLMESTIWQEAYNKALEEGWDLSDKTVLDELTNKVKNFVTETQNGITAIQTLFNTATTSSGKTARSNSASHGSSSSRSSSSAGREAERAAQQAEREAEQAAKDALNAWKEAFNIEYKKLKTYLDAELITNEEYYDALEELNKAFFEGRAEFEEEYWKYQDEIIKGRKKYLEDELKDYFTKGEKILKHQLNVEYITEEEYYDALTLLYETYYTDKEKYEEEYWKLEEEIYKLRQKQIKELEDELEDIYKEIEELHKEYVNSLKDDAEDIKDVVSYATDIIDDEIAKLKAEKEAIDEANESLERQLKLQELEENLEKAKQKKIRVYRKGQGFVYEQDTKAVGEAQTALDEYKKELQHKKQLSMIDEEIAKWEQYKKEWKSVTDSYKVSQGEMTAQAMLGESAREKILARESQVVEIVSSKYEEVQGRIEAANNATIEDLEAYIGDETTAGTFSYEIQRIKDKIDEIQSKTITLQVQTSTSGSNIQGVINQINVLKEKLEQGYSTSNIDNWSSHYIAQINAIAQASANAGVTLPGSNGSGSYNGGSYNGGSGTGWTSGAKVKINSTGKEQWPSNWLYKDSNYTVVEDDAYNAGYVKILVEGGTGGTVTHSVPASWLMGVDDVESTNNSGDSEPVTEVGRDPVYSTNSQGQQTLAGYDIRYSDGSTIYIPAYASGTLGTTSKTFKVNEEGMEAIVTPDGTVVSAPTTGYGVIKNEYTERLTDFASDPMSFLNKEFSGYSGTYKNNTSNNETININGDLSLPNVTDGESFIDSIRNVALQYTTRRR